MAPAQTATQLEGEGGCSYGYSSGLGNLCLVSKKGAVQLQAQVGKPLVRDFPGQDQFRKPAMSHSG